MAETETGSNRKGVVSKLTRSPENYIKDRVQEKINRYQIKSFRWKLAYCGMASVAAISSAVVPVLVNINGSELARIFATILGVLVAVLVSLERIFHPREHRRNYDQISAVLREEEMLFSTRAGIYGVPGQADGDPFRKFVERIEDAIAKERAETIVMRTTVGRTP
jgi:hypothetical protein